MLPWMRYWEFAAPGRMAVRGAAFAAYLNCGQVCTSAERFYVHDDIHDADPDGG